MPIMAQQALGRVFYMHWSHFTDEETDLQLSAQAQPSRK